VGVNASSYSPAAQTTPTYPLLITNADKLLGYIAARDFIYHLSNQAPQQYVPESPRLENPTLNLFQKVNNNEQHPLLATHHLTHRQPQRNQAGYSNPSMVADLPLSLYITPEDLSWLDHKHEEPFLYEVHCTVTDPGSTYSQLARDLGCITHVIVDDGDETNQLQQWQSLLLSLPSLRFLVYVPNMGPKIDVQTRVIFNAALNSQAPFLHTVVWSRIGVDHAGSSDLTAFNWYRTLEQVISRLGQPWSQRVTIIRLGFALERFLDMAADIEENQALRIPMGIDGGKFAPISLHDATWAAHTLFKAAQSGNIKDSGFHPGTSDACSFAFVCDILLIRVVNLVFVFVFSDEFDLFQAYFRQRLGVSSFTSI
jgi:hypothetical protein